MALMKSFVPAAHSQDVTDRPDLVVRPVDSQIQLQEKDFVHKSVTQKTGSPIPRLNSRTGSERYYCCFWILKTRGPLRKRYWSRRLLLFRQTSPREVNQRTAS